MAKKQTTAEASSSEDGKVSLQLRIEAELHEKLRATAEEAGISLNQLIQGICWGAIENVIQGEGKRQSNGFVSVQPRKKCLVFGKLGFYNNPQEQESLYEQGIELPPDYNGEYWFGLDFTNRGVVR